MTGSGNKMKTRRQCKILELIQERDIETQEDLLKYLCEGGYNVTQATVSRDIKELRLVKTLDKNGKYKYVSTKNDTPTAPSQFLSMFLNSVSSVDYALNTVCIKCHFGGTAQAVCASIDTMQWDGIVGTIAGEDTIFILCRTENAAATLVGELRKLFNNSTAK